MRTQNPPPSKACRFDSDLGHHRLFGNSHLPAGMVICRKTAAGRRGDCYVPAARAISTCENPRKSQIQTKIMSELMFSDTDTVNHISN